jgi:hypothetical protein
MILLRMLSILVGGLLAMLAPQFVLVFAADILGHSVQPTFKVMLLTLGAVGLCVAGFLFVGFAGHRMARSPWKRIVGGVLLLIPFFTALWVLFFSSITLMVTLAGPVLCFAAALFAMFAFPGIGMHSRRPMRPRDYDAVDNSAPLDSRP